MISLLVGLWAGSWILLRLLSSYALAVVFLSSMIGILVYRGVFYGLLWGLNFMGFYSFNLSSALIVPSILEALLSALVMAGFYFIGIIFVRRLRPEYIGTERSYLYGQK